VSAIVALVCIGLPQRSSAQGQNSVAGWADKDYVQPKPVPLVFGNLNTAIRNGRFESDEDEQQFTDFFNKFVFPSVTNRLNRQILNDASVRRDDVVTKLRGYLKACERAPNKQVFDKLVELILAYMPKIAKDPQYHPVARINAVLVIGEVNSPKAIDALLAILFDPNQFDGVRVAAMTGLINLAGQNVFSNPDATQAVVARMAAFVSKPVAKNARADGVSWMHGQAADLLAALKSVGPKREVPAALLAMLNDKEIAIPLRGKAARALGKLDYGGNAPAPTQYLTALAQLLDDALGSDQPANRARIRLIAHDVEEGMKQFASPSLANDQELHEGLKKILIEFFKQTENPMKPDELTAAINKAKEPLDSLLKNRK